MRSPSRTTLAILGAIALGIGATSVARAGAAPAAADVQGALVEAADPDDADDIRDAAAADVQGALVERADPDDADDIRDDNNPNDVGQQALPPVSADGADGAATAGAPDADEAGSCGD